MNRTRFTQVALSAAAVLAAACADVSSPNVLAPTSASFAKSGTAASGGGGGGGGGTVSTDPTTNSPATSGPPVAPSYTAHIDSIGVVPTAVYYGTPSQWTVGGYTFQANYLTHLKATAGPLVVGACVAVTFSETDGIYNASELKTVDQSKCN